VARPQSCEVILYGGTVVAGALGMLVINGLASRNPVRTPEARAAFEQGHNTGPGARDRDIRLDDSTGLVPAAFVPPESPFFPSPVTSSSGWYLPSRVITRGESPDDMLDEIRERGYLADSPIGATTCERCHPDVVAQWSASVHRFASMNNPYYEASIFLLRDSANAGNRWLDAHLERFPEDADSVGAIKSKWCGACHDPALLMSGLVAEPIDRESVEAQAGITCLACHLIDTLHNVTGNGNYNIADDSEDPYLFSNSAGGTIGAFLHDAALKAKPTAHRNRLLKPFFRESVYCATCHKVSLSEPVNNYRWLRGQNPYDGWEDSGISLNASRTFYLPPYKRDCQDCHMPLVPATRGDVSAADGLVRSHDFAAANTALPFIRGDTAMLHRVENSLREDILSVDIFALQVEGRDLPIMALDGENGTLPAGATVTVDVVVRNLGVGHTFPAGTNDSNEGWLEFSVLDSNGAVLARSGFLMEDGRLDELAHVYNAALVDGNGNLVDRRNAHDARATVYANVIPPGNSDLAHYEFQIPDELDGRELTFRARLLWRKFNQTFNEFSFRTNPEGFRAFEDVPELPVTEIESDQVTIGFSSQSAATLSGPASDSSSWMRFNDYGIALLREGNTRLAEVAFQRVEGLAPDRIDGPLNLARAAIADGNVAKAYEHLRRSEEISSGDARAAWVWGTVLQEDGRYDEAVLAYRRVLEDFPGDRAAWRNLGRTLYLDNEYEDAITAFERVLEIDPEDRISHYHLMLCFRALGRTEDAARAEAEYQYYSIDETAQALTREYRLEHPGANLMAQRVRTHRLVLNRQ